MILTSLGAILLLSFVYNYEGNLKQESVIDTDYMLGTQQVYMNAYYYNSSDTATPNSVTHLRYFDTVNNFQTYNSEDITTIEVYANINNDTAIKLIEYEYVSDGAYFVSSYYGVNESINMICTPYVYGFISSNSRVIEYQSPNSQLQTQYSNDSSVFYFGNFSDCNLYKFALDISLTDEGVVNILDNANDAIATAYQQGKNSMKNYYDNEVIPQLEAQYEAEISQTAQTEYARGFSEAENTDSVINSIFSGILSVSLVPINMFLAMLNWEIFGINVGAFVSATLSVLVIVMLFRFIFKGKASE